mmetsp:Transcript_1378/g.3535  ORF Transcript_1378/g.3535 Transcript_1378/m.3535 type:complete len:219 (+) Transcript_1378:1-657(+)|eukprot:CAMPEP_0197419224 /NCGR_PEP_ID=MMETSP1170-20131217/4724_1 /TAXON_ID=54406 /ORGANISM="Sarcinochrysis sp, Strain CCMP770" /LENGTH=218 /DNA_ID=CAMNT_0042946315 /DNA_START=1 /DNA_END=657 /DNA_ORIENTATION=-
MMAHHQMLPPRPPFPGTYTTVVSNQAAVGSEEYDWVINKLRARGYKTNQDRRAEAEEQRRARLTAWEAEKARRLAAGEPLTAPGDQDPSWWSDLKNLPGHVEGKAEIPEELMTEDQKEEKRIRDKWGGTLAETVPISDLKTISEKGYIPRSQSTCFRCGEKGHWSRDCPHNAKNYIKRDDTDDILNKDRSQLRGREARMYDKALMEKRERAHYGKYSS